MTIGCPGINQESAGSDNPSIANSKELRQKKLGNGEKKKLGQFDFRRKEKTKRWEMGKNLEKRKCSADSILAEKN